MNKKIISLIGLCHFLFSCSSLDSLKTFDQQQAMYFLHQNRTPQPTQQQIKISLPDSDKWKKIDLSFGVVGTPVMLIPKNQTPENWSQSIRTAILLPKPASKEKMIAFIKKQLLSNQKDCGNISLKFFSVKKQSVGYCITQPHCFTAKNQFQIGKAFMGRDAIYVVYYSAVEKEISGAEIRQMSRVIKMAKLVAHPAY